MNNIIDAYLASRSYAPNSIRQRRTIFNSLDGHFDPVTGTAEDFIGWWASRADLAPATRRTSWQAVKGLLDWLIAVGMRDDNPAELVRAPKVPKTPPKVLTVDQVHALRQACTSHAEQLMIELALTCGLRIAELSCVDADDLADGFLTVVGKGGKTAVVPVPADMVAIWPPAGSGPVFGVGKVTMHHRIKTVLARAGIEGHTAHSLRRTCATEMARRNVPLHVVAAVMRHDSVSTTSHYYLTVSDDDLRRAIGE